MKKFDSVLKNSDKEAEKGIFSPPNLRRRINPFEDLTNVLPKPETTLELLELLATVYKERSDLSSIQQNLVTMLDAEYNKVKEVAHGGTCAVVATATACVFVAAIGGLPLLGWWGATWFTSHLAATACITGTGTAIACVEGRNYQEVKSRRKDTEKSKLIVAKEASKTAMDELFVRLLRHFFRQHDVDPGPSFHEVLDRLSISPQEEWYEPQEAGRLKTAFELVSQTTNLYMTASQNLFED
ncbi:unnamed protein product [Clonostachys rosea]|uniref:SMODS and SLOG-associating 2TM effector domain-containing protein n=1 Tax=Bionectria ochroleuca TaxID=29856 RepID=A0ABY6U535_BIOOC|nr:unnamed protein product [Clonostachys rosea]